VPNNDPGPGEPRDPAEITSSALSETDKFLATLADAQGQAPEAISGRKDTWGDRVAFMDIQREAAEHRKWAEERELRLGEGRGY
jgi:hypothetical protein